jgi:protein O-GlcNAc transferase
MIMGGADQRRQLAIWVNDAVTRYKVRDFAGAEAIYLKVLEQVPDHADALHLYGCLCEDVGRAKQAIDLVTRATQQNPSAYPYFYNLGNLLSKQGRTEEAIRHYQTAVALKPDYAVAHNNLGLALRKQGKRDEATTCFQRAILCMTGYADPHYNLCAELKLRGDMAGAIAACREAIRLRPTYAEAHFSLGHAYAMVQRPFDAVEAFREAIRHQSDNALAFTNMGGELLKLGRVEEAVTAFQEALRIEPGNSFIHSNLLLTTSYASPDPALMRIQADQWEHDHGVPLRNAIAAHVNHTNSEQRLRIGYVSADFRHHACAYWLEPLLAAHQHDDFEIFCYSNCEAILTDAVTARLKAHSDVWVDTVTMSDEALAARIRADGIDILVDLSGHTDGNRLLVFARQPAPVQVSWFGFPGTTGLQTMHYRFTDTVMDPPMESDRFYSETLVRLSRFYAAFKPDANAPKVGLGPVV